MIWASITAQMVLVTSPVGGFHLCNCRAAIWTSFTLFNCTTQIWILSGMRLLCPEKKSPSVLKDLRDSRALLQLCRGMLELLRAVTHFVNTCPDKHSKKKKRRHYWYLEFFQALLSVGVLATFSSTSLSWVPEDMQDLWRQEELGAIALLTSIALLLGRAGEGVEALNAAAGAVRTEKYTWLCQAAGTRGILMHCSYWWAAPLFWKKSPVPGRWCCGHPRSAPRGAARSAPGVTASCDGALSNRSIHSTPCQPLYNSVVWNYSGLGEALRNLHFAI